ncbi:MAG TPA: SLBB domain-containing protein [Terriglobales bacterium]|nr:SLBB domain-containing protein [Terriglobales bacterium]
MKVDLLVPSKSCKLRPKNYLALTLWTAILSSAAMSAQSSLSVPSVDRAECEAGRCAQSASDRQGSQDQPDDPANQAQLRTQDVSNKRTEYPSETNDRQGKEIDGEETDSPDRYRRNSEVRKETDGSSDRSAEPRSRTSPITREYEPYTEFQKQVAESTGRHLPIYGQNLFHNVPTTFAPLDQVPVPPDYVVGPGDELLIRSWGQISLEARPVVDRSGQIFLAKVGTVNIAGVHYDQLEYFLRKKVERYFRNFDLSVSMGKLRSIQVQVVGMARRPGSYTIGSFSTLASALYAAGGPALYGSMRHIQLRRNGKLVSELDLYDLLLRGESTNDVPLLPADIIYIAPIGPQVAICGSVTLPAIYELKGGTTPKQAIEMAGGLAPAADSRHILLETTNVHQQRELQNVDVEAASAQNLQNGDIVTIKAMVASMEKVLWLRGNVGSPGRYAWHEGMRIRDLIPSHEALITRGYMNHAKNMGGNSGDWYNEKTAPKKVQSTPGAKPAHPRENDYGLQVIRMSAEVNWEHATIQRRQNDLSTIIIPFNLGEALSGHSENDNLELKDHDIVTIFGLQDIQSSTEKRTHTVHIEGEVNAPGAYTAAAGDTLRDMVNRAGGLTSSAYLFATEFRRESTRREQQKQIEQMADSMDKNLRSKTAALPKSNADERAAAQEQLAAEGTVLEKLRQTKATGRIVLEINPADTDISALPVLRLEDGDRLIIPPRPATVEVVGAVYNQNSFIYKTGKTVRDCLQQSGGGTRDADARRLFVVRADGTVISKQMHRGLWKGNFESMQLTPGDTIVMPERIRTGSFLKGIRDWSQAFSQFALGAAALRVISP